MSTTTQNTIFTNFSFTNGSLRSLALNLKKLLDEHKISKPELTSEMAWEFARKFKGSEDRIINDDAFNEKIFSEFFSKSNAKKISVPVTNIESKDGETKNEAIKRLFFSGVSTSDIAEKVCKENTHPYQRANNTIKQIKARIKEMQTKHMTHADMALKLGVPEIQFNETLKRIEI